MKAKWVPILLVFGLLSLLSFDAPLSAASNPMLAQGPKSAKPVSATKHVWKFQSVYGGTGQATKMGCWEWADYIEKGTHGQITFQRYHSSQLVPFAKSLDALEKGILDVLFAGGTQFAGLLPYADFFMLPATFTDNFYAQFDFFWNTEGGKLLKKWFLEDKKVHLIMPVPASGQITFTRPKQAIKTLAEYKGKQIHISAGAMAKVMEKLGGVPVTGITGAEAYTALQRGMVDGSSWVCYSFETYRYHEVCQAVTVPGLIAPTGPMIWISAKAWDKLTPDLKEKIEEASRWNAVRLVDFAWNELHVDTPKWCRQYKMDYNVLPQSDQIRLKEIQQTVAWGEFEGRDPRCAQLIQILRNYIQTRFPKELKKTW